MSSKTRFPFVPRRITGCILVSVLWLLPLVGLPLVFGGCNAVVEVDDGSGNDSSNGGGEDSPEDDLDPAAPPVTTGNWYRPAVEVTWQWQLQPDANGRINTNYDVDVYDIDLFDTDPAFVAGLQEAGRRVICYFSAGSFEDFREDSGSFLAADLGNPLDDFADERWLDIRSDHVRQIMLRRLDLAVQKGCDGVEPDNVDGFANNSGFDLTAGDQLAFNRFIANAGHQRGLSVGLKNDLDQVVELVDYFDFSVNEQCHEFDECGLLTPFIESGKPVFNAEYRNDYATNDVSRTEMCTDAVAREFRTLVLPIDLDDSIRFSCGE